MDYKVVLAPRAIDDLRDIVLYVAPDRPEAPKRVVVTDIDFVEQTELRVLVAAAHAGVTMQALQLPQTRLQSLREQACVMVYGPGHYRFTDFMRVGLPLTILLLIIALVLVPQTWPLQ